MKRVFYVLMCVAGLTALQGCFWHSSTVERDSTTPATSTTTVVAPGTTTTTTP